MSIHPTPSQPDQSLPSTGDLAEQILGGDNLHGEVAGCPTGLSDPNRESAEEAGAGHTDEVHLEVEELKGSPITGRAR